ncbi:uncharacterized protein BO80DRAFT_434385 [Aspergillus ibericus CBS 121593]|uniref:Uncharacterized protein n=1 Tax=Aspergillus ibericus CBS 121593 TaxID=1448316 RepID=A0A395H0V6_9EURO|nr:hypothetical protein BO80DRAFT_434385 [Aspergillus ibericus CBS 121593]RAL01456.1 hypothetical protein BO80DRAFT_434385 [Aspergillus ibericus CBS 121593]
MTLGRKIRVPFSRIGDYAAREELGRVETEPCRERWTVSWTSIPGAPLSTCFCGGSGSCAHHTKRAGAVPQPGVCYISTNQYIPSQADPILVLPAEQESANLRPSPRSAVRLGDAGLSTPRPAPLAIGPRPKLLGPASPRPRDSLDDHVSLVSQAATS